MTRLILLASLTLLAACGVNGEPERPEGSPDLTPGITISGQVGFGIAGHRD